MSEPLLRKAQVKPQKLKPISVTYDTTHNQLVILCDDGSLWRRSLYIDPNSTGAKIEWVTLGEFDPE